MKRDSLRRYLQRLAVASLSIGALQACTGNCPTRSDEQSFQYAGSEPDGGWGNFDDGGWLPIAVCKTACTQAGFARIRSCRGYIDTSNANQPYNAIDCQGDTLDCPFLEGHSSPNGTGRRTAGLHEAPALTADLAGWLAGAAHLEAASIDAFVRLAGELRLHGAPVALIERVLVAADDERRHAAALGRLARRHGAAVPPVEIDAVRERSLEEVACENAVEGCVGESFGAASTVWQAATATHQPLRSAMRRISADETQHAELAFDVSRWADSRLDRAARRRIRDQRRAAVDRLGRSLERPLPPSLQSQAGLPPRPAARRIWSEMSRLFWS